MIFELIRRTASDTCFLVRRPQLRGLVLLMLVLGIGCDRGIGRVDVPSLNRWQSSGHSGRPQYNLNFYNSLVPNVAIISYSPSPSDAETSDLVLIMDSLRLAKLQFAKCYAEGRLCDGYGELYQPEHLIVLVDSLSGNYRAGAVFSFSAVFNDAVNPGQINIVRNIERQKNSGPQVIAERLLEEYPMNNVDSKE